MLEKISYQDRKPKSQKKKKLNGVTFILAGRRYCKKKNRKMRDGGKFQYMCKTNG